VKEAKTPRRDNGLKEHTKKAEEVSRLSVLLSRSLHKRLKMRAIEEDHTTIGQIVIKAITAYLETPIANE
jgi:hypothetical protein